MSVAVVQIVDNEESGSPLLLETCAPPILDLVVRAFSTSGTRCRLVGLDTQADGSLTGLGALVTLDDGALYRVKDWAGSTAEVLYKSGTTPLLCERLVYVPGLDYTILAYCDALQSGAVVWGEAGRTCLWTSRKNPNAALLFRVVVSGKRSSRRRVLVADATPIWDMLCERPAATVSCSAGTVDPAPAVSG